VWRRQLSPMRSGERVRSRAFHAGPGQVRDSYEIVGCVDDLGVHLRDTPSGVAREGERND
jgi:hypothetical protein